MRDNFSSKPKRSFTLIELLVVLALVAILSVVVVVTLNPAELIKQARDSNRLSDLSTINTALNLFSADVTSGFMGTSTVVYVSIPSNLSDCSNLGLPILPGTFVYNCVTQQNLRNIDGTGWIPVNFQRISYSSPISQLPIDPQNTTSTKYYTYVTGGSWQLAVRVESQKYAGQAAKTNDYDPGLYVVGNNTSLAPFIGGLVGWWKFDETGATSTDSSGFNNDGTMYSSTTIADVHSYSGCKTGAGCVVFDGTSNWIGTSLDFGWNNTNQATVLFWVKPDSIIDASYMPLIGKKYPNWEWAIYKLNAAVSLVYWTFGGGHSNEMDSSWPGSLIAGSWNFVAYSWDGRESKFYSGDSSVGSKVAGDPSTNQNNNEKLNIGGHIYTWGDYFFKGAMDDVRIYNRTLSAAEILSIYNSTK